MQNELQTATAGIADSPLQLIQPITDRRFVLVTFSFSSVRKPSNIGVCRILSAGNLCLSFCRSFCCFLSKPKPKPKPNPTQKTPPTMMVVGFDSVSRAMARSSVSLNSSVIARALSTSESLKVSSTTMAPPPVVARKEERIKYFKIYRWDPDHRQKPVSASQQQ
jgi:hypothetical protein